MGSCGGAVTFFASATAANNNNSNNDDSNLATANVLHDQHELHRAQIARTEKTWQAGIASGVQFSHRIQSVDQNADLLEASSASAATHRPICRPAGRQPLESELEPRALDLDSAGGSDDCSFRGIGRAQLETADLAALSARGDDDHSSMGRLLCRFGSLAARD
jgi:hypothetical protein